MTAILGINCFSHDTSACILVDGIPVAMGEEERFNRDRHTKLFPDNAIQFCLEQAGLAMSDVDAVAFAHQPWKDFLLGASDALARLSPKRLAAQSYVDARLVYRERYFRKRWGWRGAIYHVGHHLAHTASAYYASPFDSAAILTLDRGGDFLSTTLSFAEGHRIKPLAKVRNPHSLGEVYSALTWYLGFLPNADEGKVMGLAPYGTDKYVDSLRGLLKLTSDGLFKVNLSWFNYQREGLPLSKRFIDKWGAPRVPESDIDDLHKDLSYAIQVVTEEAALHIAKALQRTTGARYLCLSGGVALNSVMNTRIAREAGFDDVFIQPAAADCGNSLGAALFAWHQMLGQARAWEMLHPYLGPAFTTADALIAMKSAGLDPVEIDDPAHSAASMIADGKVIGWFQGRAEIGPRALGARSIIADPRQAEMRDRVNAQVKRREWFRPFAPSVAEQHASTYFEDYIPNPFMLMVESIKQEYRNKIAAVTHVDGTGRLQTVTKQSNAAFYDLIEETGKLTGIPVVLNTSFNLRGEPIVNRPEEAVADFLRSDMDALFIEGAMATKDTHIPQKDTLKKDD